MMCIHAHIDLYPSLLLSFVGHQKGGKIWDLVRARSTVEWVGIQLLAKAFKNCAVHGSMPLPMQSCPRSVQVAVGPVAYA